MQSTEVEKGSQGGNGAPEEGKKEKKPLFGKSARRVKVAAGAAPQPEPAQAAGPPMPGVPVPASKITIIPPITNPAIEVTGLLSGHGGVQLYPDLIQQREQRVPVRSDRAGTGRQRRQDLLALIKDTLQRTLGYEWEKLHRAGQGGVPAGRAWTRFIETRGIKVSEPITKKKLGYYIIRDFVEHGVIDVMMSDDDIEDISCDGINIPIFVSHRKYESITVQPHLQTTRTT